MPITVENAPAIASALLALRGETQASLSKKSGIRVANLSVWLRGKKDQVISERRVTALLEYLGVVGGCFKKYAVHDWIIEDNISNLKLVLEELIPFENQATTFILVSKGLNNFNTAVIAIPQGTGFILIKLTLKPGLSEIPKLTREALGFGVFIFTSDIIPDWPSAKLEEDDYEDIKNQIDILENTLIAEMRSATEEDFELLDDFVDLIVARAAPKRLIGAWSSGLEELSAALVRVLDKNVSPKEIADLISKQYLL